MIPTPPRCVSCPAHPIPGGSMCADCLIAWAATQPARYWIARDRMAGL